MAFRLMLSSFDTLVGLYGFCVKSDMTSAPFEPSARESNRLRACFISEIVYDSLFFFAAGPIVGCTLWKDDEDGLKKLECNWA